MPKDRWKEARTQSSMDRHPNIQKPRRNGQELRDAASLIQTACVSKSSSLLVPFSGQLSQEHVVTSLLLTSPGSAKVYPRTDPVAIGLIVSPNHQRCLLGRSHKCLGQNNSLKHSGCYSVPQTQEEAQAVAQAELCSANG